MLTDLMAPSACAFDRDIPEPRLSRPVVRLQALAPPIQRAFLFVVAAALAVSIVLTAHQVPRWQEDLARIPFVD
jgi:hypothetical protein